MHPIYRKIIPAFGALLLAALAAPACAQSASPAAEVEAQVKGLWFYTGLATSDGVERPLTGVFLFKDGAFVQQAVFDGEPYEAQGSMAHAGPYEARTGHVHLVAEQTLSTAPGSEQVYSSRGTTEHDVTVSREGTNLTLVFSMGTGTVQRFAYVGPGEGELHALDDGMLALVDGHFVLVQGNAEGSVSGYGTYTRNGNDLDVNLIRWTEADANGVKNLRDAALRATFDGRSLGLGDGRSFSVKP